jgi:hypothetical protein
LGEILLELKKEFIDNPKNITQLVDQLVDDIKNKDQE